MPSIIVIYHSKYGATKQYAQWLASELQADLKEYKKIKKHDLDAYDTIIYGGGIYMGHVNGVSLITKHLSSLQNKKLIVFGVGLLTPNEALTQTLQATVPDTTFFYLRGSLNYMRLNLKDKILMQGLKRMLKQIPNPTEEQLEILEAYDEPVNFVKKSNLGELLHFIKQEI